MYLFDEHNLFIYTQTDDCEPTEIFRDHVDVVKEKPGRYETLQKLFKALHEVEIQTAKRRKNCSSYYGGSQLGFTCIGSVMHTKCGTCM